MPAHASPSGIPGPSGGLPKNRWLRAIERRPTAWTAASGFVAYMAGVLLLMASVFIMIGGLVMVTGDAGSGWTAHVAGAGLLVGGAVLFAIGRWLLLAYSVQRPSR